MSKHKMTTPTYRTPRKTAELRFQVLIEKLGCGGVVAFISQYETGEGDYTEERKQLFRGVTLAKIKQDIRRQS